MEIADLLATPIVDTLAKTLLHTLWQGAAVALIVMVFMRALRASSPVTRYRLSCAGLALTVALPLLTFAYLDSKIEPNSFRVEPSVTALTSNTTVPNPAATETLQTAAPNTRPPTEGAPSAFNPPARVAAVSTAEWLPYLVVVWLLGVVLLSIRLLGGFIVSRRFKQAHTRAVSEGLNHRLETLRGRLGITRSVQLLESLTLPVPLVVGWLKPAILIPTSVLSGLTPQQLELVLAHELAHVRRNDYLVNLLQSAAETLLFYHPAVWWLSQTIRAEREHCCDDLAVALCGDKLAYARTLARLNELTTQQRTHKVSWPKTSLAITGGSLLKRIQRLANRPEYSSNSLTWLLGLGLLVIPFSILSVATAQAELPIQIEENIDAFVENRLAAWTVPGMQVAVLQDGELTFNKGYGLADVEAGTPMSADTPVPLGSASWLVNAIAALKLVEDGSLSLDSTLNEVLPWVEFSEGEEAELTVSDFLFGGANVSDTVRFEGVQHSQDSTSGSLDFDASSKEALIRSLMPERLDSSLGTVIHPDYNYVLNDTLLALILEAASGQSHEALLAETVFAPLDISAGYAPAPGAASTYLSSGNPDGPQDIALNSITPAEALRSVVGLSLSSRDLASLLQALVTKDERLLTQASWDTLFTPDPNLWGAGGWAVRSVEGQGLFAAIGGTEGSEVFIEVIPEAATAYLTMTNYAIPNDRHPLYQVLGSVAVALRLLEEPISNSSDTLDETQETDAGKFFTERMVGDYASALGTIRLYADGETLKGELLGNEITLKRAGSSQRLTIRSDYEPLNNVYVGISGSPPGLTFLGRQFAYRLE